VPCAWALDPSQPAMSAWNKAGTWEEKDCTAFAQELLTASLANVKCTSDDATAVEVTNVKDVQGHAHVLVVRGTMRVGMEFTINVAWKATDTSGAEATGEGVVFEMAETDVDDFELEFKNIAGALKSATAKKAAKSLHDPMREVVKSMMEQVLAKYPNPKA